MRLFGIAGLAVLFGFVPLNHVNAKEQRKSSVCTVKAQGNQKDDVPNILEAFHQCGHGGTVVFPEDQSYWIGTRLNPVVNDVSIDWRGKWTVS